MIKRTHGFWYTKTLSLIQNIGYYDLTLFQKRVIPYILKENDLAIETSGFIGENTAFILPLFIKIKNDGRGIKAVILTSKEESVNKIFKKFKYFLNQKKLSIIMLSSKENIKDEARYIYKKPDIIIGTSERIIDHIRRGNIPFQELKTVVIKKVPKEKDEESGFFEDLQFIFSKLPRKKQTVLFSPYVDKDSAGMSLLKRPLILTGNDFSILKSKNMHSYFEVKDDEKPRLLTNLINGGYLPSSLIICDNEESVKKLANHLAHNNIKAQILLTATDKLTTDSHETTLSPAKNHIITTDKAVSLQCITWISHLVNYNTPQDDEHYEIRCRYMANDCKQVFTFVTKDEFFKLIKIQENNKVDIKKQKLPSDDDVIKGLIERIIKRIKEQEDPDELNSFRKIVKKHVPIFLRSYFMAYLFKQTLTKDTIQKEKQNGFTTLFISIGKNRRIYPKDLVSLFMNTLKIKRSDIGDIKILDNYSFIDISLNYAPDAISKLSGFNFHGRRISVNLARKKG